MSTQARRMLEAAGFAVVLVAPIAAIPGSALAASFSPGNLVIYRVGTGTGTLTSAATAVSLDEYTTTGALVQSIALPSNTTAGAALTSSGSATSEGLLTLSTDGHALLVPGYAATAGTTGIASTASTAVPREVAVVDATGTATSFTTLGTFATGNNIRSAASADGVTIYATSTTAVGTFTAGANGTPTTISATMNGRSVTLANGQAFASSGSSPYVGINVLGTAGAPSTTLAASSSTDTSPYQFAFANTTTGGATPDTLYVTDSGSKLFKYNFNAANNTASLVGTVAIPSGVTGLTAVASGTIQNLYLTSPTALLTVADPFGSDATAFGAETPTTLATASANEAFRGVAFAPTAAPEPTSLLLAGIAAAPLLIGRRRRHLV